MNTFDDIEVISAYPLDRAITDGVMVEIFKNRWQQLSGGKPIVATATLFNEISLAGLMEIWNEFAHWHKFDKPALPEDDQLFKTGMNNRTVWIVEDDMAFTLMYPEDY
jgi:hypothetical protein